MNNKLRTQISSFITMQPNSNSTLLIVNSN